MRRPEVFPLDLATRELIGRHAGGADDTDAAETPRLPETPATRARTASHHPQPIQGGPVDVPVAKLTRVFRVAWFCHPYTQPEIRIELPQGAKRPAQPEIENVNVAGRGREMAITFENTGQQDGAIEALVPLAKQLAALPDRTVIEIHAARARTLSAGARPVGLHRYRGRVEAGQWRVSEAFPPVDAARLAEAIALAVAAEGGKALRARDEAEAERIEARVMRHAPHAFHSNPLLRNGAELGVKRRDPRALTEVAMRAFWMRYADAWPLQDFDLEPE